MCCATIAFREWYVSVVLEPDIRMGYVSIKVLTSPIVVVVVIIIIIIGAQIIIRCCYGVPSSRTAVQFDSISSNV
jgi:hypothetical protein